MLKNIINIILGLFGGSKNQETAESDGDWSSGDYDRYADLKKEGKEEYLAQKERQKNSGKA